MGARVVMKRIVRTDRDRDRDVHREDVRRVRNVSYEWDVAIQK